MQLVKNKKKKNDNHPRPLLFFFGGAEGRPLGPEIGGERGEGEGMGKKTDFREQNAQFFFFYHLPFCVHVYVIYIYNIY